VTFNAYRLTRISAEPSRQITCIWYKRHQQEEVGSVTFPLMVASSNSILSPRSRLRCCAPRPLPPEPVDEHLLVPNNKVQLSGVETECERARLRFGRKHRFLERVYLYSTVNCSTRISKGLKSSRRRRVSCATRARVGATYATHPLSGRTDSVPGAFGNCASVVFLQMSAGPRPLRDLPGPRDPVPARRPVAEQELEH
jgi:hypothetical protein